MSRELSDQVALAADGVDKPDRTAFIFDPALITAAIDRAFFASVETVEGPILVYSGFDPREQLTGLARRLFKSSNATTFRDPPFWNLS